MIFGFALLFVAVLGGGIASVAGFGIGTFLGTKVLTKLPERKFRRIVSAFIFLLGFLMFYQGLMPTK